MDACIEGSSDEELGSDEENMQDDGAGITREPDVVQLTAEQQADLDDGWGVVVKTTRGRRKEIPAGMDQS